MSDEPGNDTEIEEMDVDFDNQSAEAAHTQVSESIHANSWEMHIQ